MGERHVMRFEKVAPPPAAEEFYIGFAERQNDEARTTSGNTSSSEGARQRGLAKIPQLIAAGMLTPGEILRIRGKKAATRNFRPTAP